MDKLINEPPEVYPRSQFYFLPYLNQYNRELFYRTNINHDLYDKFISKVPKNSKEDPRFVVHVPFSQKEHEAVLKYLLLTKYYNLHDPIHAQPFQIMCALNKKDQKGEFVQRSSESIIQYLSEIYIQQSTLFNADDKIIFLTSKPPSFPKKEISNQFHLSDQIKQIGMNSERSKLIKIQDILPQVIVIFITDVSPIVVDLSVGLSKNAHQPQYEACFLMSNASRFLISGTPEFCSDRHRFCCFYEQGTLNFIDLKHRVKFRNKDTVIPSFKCFPYPCYESLYNLCACPDLDDDENMLIAAITDSGKISAWMFHWADRTISRSSYDPLNSEDSIKPPKEGEINVEKSLKLEWIQRKRLAVVIENRDIKIIPFPWEGKEIEPEFFTMDVPHHFVECQGDAYVLEEEIRGPQTFSSFSGNENFFENNSSDGSSIQEIPETRSEFSSSSNASENEDQPTSFRKKINDDIILGQNHRIHVFAHNGDQFEVEIDQQIIACAYVNNNLAITSYKGEIFVFDKNVRYARAKISKNPIVSSIVPVNFYRPMFARLTKTNVKFFDNHGNSSIEHSFIDLKSPADNSLKIDSFYSRNGFAVSISSKFEIGIKWFF